MKIKYILICLLVGGISPTAAAADNFPTPLAYEAEQINVADYVARPRVQGVAVYWDGVAFLTADGKVATPPKWFVRGFGDTPMAGALVDRRSDKNALVRILNRAKEIDEGWKTVRFVAFDLPDDERPFDERQNALGGIVEKANSRYLELARWQKFADAEALQNALDAMYEKGGAGYVLRHKQSQYAAGNYPLYVALPYAVGTAVVRQQIPGKGDFVGMMGSLEVVDEQGSEFLIASGFARHERRNPPAIGSRIAYRYKGYTATGKPKRPVFLRLLPPAHKKIGGVVGTQLLSWLFISLMLLLAALDAYSHARRRRRDGARWNFKSAIVSMGLLGTFVGIWWGLYNFDATQIRSSVPVLLDGLKFSFITSIFGIALSTGLSIVQTLLGQQNHGD